MDNKSGSGIEYGMVETGGGRLYSGYNYLITPDCFPISRVRSGKPEPSWLLIMV